MVHANLFVRLTEIEEIEFLRTLNNNLPYPLYQIIYTGLGAGIWKKMNDRIEDSRYVQINTSLQKQSLKNITISGNFPMKHAFTLCISSDFRKVGLLYFQSKVSFVCLPRHISYDWLPFWNAYEVELQNLQQYILSLYIFFRSIDFGDPNNHVYHFLVPTWFCKIIEEHIFFRKTFSQYIQI
jgi:hypothetical protein